MTQEKSLFDQVTVKQLRDKAGELGISGRWDMTKAQLAHEIAEVSPNRVFEIGEFAVCEFYDGTIGATYKVKVTEQEAEAEEVVVDEEEGEDPQGVKDRYLETVPIGTIVAFKATDGRVRSAAIENRNRAKKKLKLKTEYGAEFICNFEDVLWARTGKRWPKGVYQLLKGVATDEQSAE